jgi:hypothetical protein
VLILTHTGVCFDACKRSAEQTSLTKDINWVGVSCHRCHRKQVTCFSSARLPCLFGATGKDSQEQACPRTLLLAGKINLILFSAILRRNTAKARGALS